MAGGIIKPPPGRGGIMSMEGKPIKGFPLTVPVGGGTQPPLNRWFNSSEPGGDGSNTDYLMADNFERGWWYKLNYDDALLVGDDFLSQCGWGGNIFDPITPASASDGPGFRSTWAATSGYLDGTIGGHNMAEHGFVSGTTVTEAYFRLYFQRQSDYIGGHEKMFDFTRGFGTAQMLGLAYNYFGTGRIRFISYLHQDDSRPGGAENWLIPNMATELVCTNGHWYFLEMHMVLNTGGLYNGTFEMWMDDFGTDGYSGPSTPTLRCQYNDIMWLNGTTEAGYTIGGIWIENWANEPSTGTTFYDNIIVSRTGPIGFTV